MTLDLPPSITALACKAEIIPHRPLIGDIYQNTKSVPRALLRITAMSGLTVFYKYDLDESDMAKMYTKSELSRNILDFHERVAEGTFVLIKEAYER